MTSERVQPPNDHDLAHISYILARFHPLSGLVKALLRKASGEGGHRELQDGLLLQVLAVEHPTDAQG